MPEANINRKISRLSCCQLLREISTIVTKLPEQNFKKIIRNRSRTSLRLAFSTFPSILKFTPCFVSATHELVRAVDVMTGQQKIIYLSMINESKQCKKIPLFQQDLFSNLLLMFLLFSIIKCYFAILIVSVQTII